MLFRSGARATQEPLAHPLHPALQSPRNGGAEVGSPGFQSRWPVSRARRHHQRWLSENSVANRQPRGAVIPLHSEIGPSGPEFWETDFPPLGIVYFGLRKFLQNFFKIFMHKILKF